MFFGGFLPHEARGVSGLETNGCCFQRLVRQSEQVFIVKDSSGGMVRQLVDIQNYNFKFY